METYFSFNSHRNCHCSDSPYIRKVHSLLFHLYFAFAVSWSACYLWNLYLDSTNRRYCWKWLPFPKQYSSNHSFNRLLCISCCYPHLFLLLQVTNLFSLQDHRAIGCFCNKKLLHCTYSFSSLLSDSTLLDSLASGSVWILLFGYPLSLWTQLSLSTFRTI